MKQYKGYTILFDEDMWEWSIYLDGEEVIEGFEGDFEAVKEFIDGLD